jgi:hypothetical protein
MNQTVSSDAFDTFFAWAPWVVGITIYLVFYFAKRREIATSMAAAHASALQPHATQSFACSQCGRRGPREQMIAQDHGGAVGYQCTTCAQEAPV